MDFGLYYLYEFFTKAPMACLPEFQFNNSQQPQRPHRPKGQPDVWCLVLAKLSGGQFEGKSLFQMTGYIMAIHYFN